MQTHDDRDSTMDAEFLKKLEARAQKMTAEKSNTITAGKIEEAPISRWVQNNITVTKMPDDEHGILRLSIGGGIEHMNVDYLVFRGDREACVRILERALVVLRDGKKTFAEELNGD